MSVRGYTMKENKAIVDYIKENKAYSLVRGRKFWMDFANTNITTRTWQSLKETFLKRILLEIHNPYYKLEPHELQSFREEKDLSNKIRKKLESKLPEKDEENGDKSDSNNVKESTKTTKAGEDVSNNRSNRESVDTLVLSSNSDNDTQTNEEFKSLRDRFQYTEPLTPMMQNILNDFDSEDEEIQKPTSNVDSDQSTQKDQIQNTESNEKNASKVTTQDTANSISLPNNQEALNKEESAEAIIIQKKKSLQMKKSASNRATRKSSRTENKNNDMDADNLTQVTDEDLNNVLESTEQEPVVNTVAATNGLDVKSTEKKAAKKRRSNIISSDDSNDIPEPTVTKPNEEKTVDEEATVTKSNKEKSLSPQRENGEKVLNEDNKTSKKDAKDVESSTAIGKNADVDDDILINENDTNVPISKEKLNPCLLPSNLFQSDWTENLVEKSSSPILNINNMEKKSEEKEVKSKKFGKLLTGLFSSVDKSWKSGRKPHTTKQSPIKECNGWDSDSSESTSDSDALFVSPPHSRNRTSRKYLKPSASRILSLGQEGGLFVISGKKVYPLVRNGKQIKHLLRYDPDSDAEDEEESHWRRKYIQEKLLNDKLSRLVQKQQQQDIVISDDDDVRADKPTTSKEVVKEVAKEEEPVKQKHVKIKIAKNNEEISLEGHWQDLQPILSDVALIFKSDKNTSEANNNLPQIDTNKKDNDDEAINQRVASIEAEIFNEIDARDKTDNEQSPPRITERTRRPRKSNLKTRVSRNQAEKLAEKPPKRAKTNENNNSDDEIIINEDKLKPIKANAEVGTPSKRRRTAKNVSASEDGGKRRRTLKNDSDSDGNVTLYKLPSPNKQNDTSNNPKGHISDANGDTADYDIKQLRNKTLKVKNVYKKKTKTNDKENSCVSNESNITQNEVDSKDRSSYIYKTESYQFLVERNVEKLTKIPETSPCPNEMLTSESHSFNLSPESQRISSEKSDQINLEANSSSISLPMSPELSIVENLSIDKNLLYTDYPSLNEQQVDSILSPEEQYLLTQVDITVPLMEQLCNYKANESVEKMDIGTTMSETFLNNEQTNTTKDATISQSLDNRLQNLLLDSAKANDVVREKVGKDKNKRCSTPCKRKPTKAKPKKLPVDVIEEKMEYCRSGRKSCPPVYISIHDETTVNIDEIKKKRKPKDVIKVKIQKPKKKAKSTSRLSIHTDSGINETANSLMNDLNRSVELIHNHSETCLRTNECFDSSVQFVPNDDSVITINTSSVDVSVADSSSQASECSDLPLESYSCEAQDGTKGVAVPKPTLDPTERTSLGSLNSILTEDLSIELPNSNREWFFLSEDENSNTTNIAPPKCNVHANLNHLFPVICSIPDLSTITEQSRDTDSQSHERNTQ